MKPNIEEAWHFLRLADRDIKTFYYLALNPEIHISITYFHGQQAIEKCLKAVLYSREIEFKRIHDISDLAELLIRNRIELPISNVLLDLMSPFAVIFRYDDEEFEDTSSINPAEWVPIIRKWAEVMIQAAAD